MADELDEEWWENEGKRKKNHRNREKNSNNTKSVKSESHKSERNKKSKVTKLCSSSPNRDKNASESKPTKRKLQSDESDAVKKKRRKKTISHILATNDIKDPKEEFLAILKAYFEEKLSPLEKEELQIDETDIINLTLDKQSSLANCLQNEFPKVTEKLKKNVNKCGTPIVLVLAESALRVLDLKRDLQSLTPEHIIAKLFAKHMKIEQQRTLLSNSNIKIAIGTPHRVLELINLDALSIDRLRYIILDWSFRDEKQRRAVDIGEIKASILQLFTKHLLSKVKLAKTKIILV